MKYTAVSCIECMTSDGEFLVSSIDHGRGWKRRITILACQECGRPMFTTGGSKIIFTRVTHYREDGTIDMIDEWGPDTTDWENGNDDERHD